MDTTLVHKKKKKIQRETYRDEWRPGGGSLEGGVGGGGARQAKQEIAMKSKRCSDLSFVHHVPLLAGCPPNLVCKLQNNIARLIYRSVRSDPRVSDAPCSTLASAESRVQYKVIILTFESLHNQALSCLCNLIQLCVPSRQLRSSADTPLLRLPFHQVECSNTHTHAHTHTRTHTCPRFSPHDIIVYDTSPKPNLKDFNE